MRVLNHMYFRISLRSASVTPGNFPFLYAWKIGVNLAMLMNLRRSMFYWFSLS